MHTGQRLLGRLRQDLILKRVESFAVVFEDGKAVVDDEVEQPIEQIIAATSA